jgi:OPA family glycerol-3-phosphate transporter-like MFS transporter
MALTLLGLVANAMTVTVRCGSLSRPVIAVGFFIYGPIMMIGLHALDLVPKKARGPPQGFTGCSATLGSRRRCGHRWDCRHWGLGAVFVER